MPRKIAGLGRKHPQLDVAVKRLRLDSENPRLPEEAQGKSEAEVLSVLYREFALDALADSMAKNGYFDEEPLVAIPQKLPQRLQKADINSEEFLQYVQDGGTELTVVEGNRRLATIKILLDPKLRDTFRIRHWPSLSAEVDDDLRVLPAIIYMRRSDVIPYLGVRHIVGIQKWDSYAKARYIAKMIEEGLSIEAVEAQIGDDKQSAIVRNFICYRLLKQASDEFDFDIKKAKEDFSLLLLAIGQSNIKRFLGLPKKLLDADLNYPTPPDNAENLRDLMSWLFGSGKERPVIAESRDITNLLTHIVSSQDAIDYLKKTKDIQGAYDRTDGEEKMLLKYLNTANQKLEGALSVAHRHRTADVIAEVEKCQNTAKTLLKVVKEQND
jgi:hypothetical protein